MKKIEKISKRWLRTSWSKRGHIPVMCKEVIEFLRPEDKRIIVDCTVGLGGHALEILKRMPSQGRLIGIDRDKESLALAREGLSLYSDRVLLFHADFKDVDVILKDSGIKYVDGFLLDLGVSMYQLGYSERGFSFLRDGPLDMRMDRSKIISAYDLVNKLSERELSYIFKEYGEERWHKRIAQTIVKERKVHPITTTLELSQLVERAISSKKNYFRIHPATRVFQALRIAVNQELESLEICLKKAGSFLAKQGRICVISFHSLEDRRVKRIFKDFSKKEGFHIVTSRPLRPSKWEVAFNPRASSAKLRVLEKI